VLDEVRDFVVNDAVWLTIDRTNTFFMKILIAILSMLFNNIILIWFVARLTVELKCV